ncbi:MAG: phosphatidylserine decarboxylase [Halieaceae bacterium]|jgi:phosphatidylserine decarboxylase
MDRLFIFFQHFVPQHLLSRATGVLADLCYPIWLKNWVIKQFIAQYKVNMDEAQEPNPEAYANFNAFFTRSLAEGSRPIAHDTVVCPADGAISQLGAIEQGRIFQAKGQWYTAQELLGGDVARAALFDEGEFATIYLSPKDYHRVHMPLAGKLTATTYIPGKLFSVNGVTAENVERLFARNERLVCYFDTDLGPMALILVGAMVVAGIETVWSGQVAPPTSTPSTLDFANLPDEVNLGKGDEMGRFKLGSTAILLFTKGVIDWDDRYVAGTATRLGEGLAAARS